MSWYQFALSRDDDDKKEKKGCWPVAAVTSLIFLSFVVWIWPWSIEPFTLFSLWGAPAGQELMQPFAWAETAWPMFAWGVGLTFLFQMLAIKSNKNLMEKYKERLALADAEGNYLKGMLISVWAGVAEEMAFRWVFFLWGMVGIKITNWLFFGWAGFGLAEHIYLWIVGPIANFFTLGLMEQWLFHPAHWAIGAAIIAANAKFRDGHKYQGIIGYLNSWFAGMFLFWCMFTFGLVGAIAIHFAYDFLVFTCVYLMQVVRRFRS